MPAKGAVAATCAALNLSRASLHRSAKRQSLPLALPVCRPSPSRALSTGSLKIVRDLLRSPRFVDLAPAEIYATLLDEGIYHCSVSTMYRILHANSEVCARHKQLRHPAYTKPELLAVAPNEVWSWDITKLTSVSLAPAKLAKREGRDQQNGPTSIYTSSSTSSAGAWSVGAWPMPKVLPCSRLCSTTPSPSIQ
jgi:hypothetical protein